MKTNLQIRLILAILTCSTVAAAEMVILRWDKSTDAKVMAGKLLVRESPGDCNAPKPWPVKQIIPGSYSTTTRTVPVGPYCAQLAFSTATAGKSVDTKPLPILVTPDPPASSAGYVVIKGTSMQAPLIIKGK